MNPAPARTIAVIFLHPHCNMRCSYCITEESFSPMRYEQALSLLDALAQRGVETVVLGGGEPFTWPGGVLRLAGDAKRRGFVVQIGTNGIALPPDYAVRAEVDRYVLPVDAPEAAGHNRFRVYSGDHHAIMIERLATLRRAGKAVTVSTVVNAQNVAMLPRLGALLADYVIDGGRLHAWHLYRFIPRGRGGRRHAESLGIPESEYDAACDAVRSGGLNFTVYKRRDMRHSRTVDFFWYEGEQRCAGSEVWAARPVG